MKALKLRGYRIPEDVAIAGFDNISESRIVEPSLTTIDIPRTFMGQTAARQLIHQITTPVPHTVKIKISTKIEMRIQKQNRHRKLKKHFTNMNTGFRPQKNNSGTICDPQILNPLLYIIPLNGSVPEDIRHGDYCKGTGKKTESLCHGRIHGP